MKQLILAMALCVYLPLTAQFNPQPKAITKAYFPDPAAGFETPGASKKKGYMTHEEYGQFLLRLQREHPGELTIDTLGYSQLGRAIYSVHLPALDTTKTPARLWMQGGLHGDEPASSEGVLHFLQECLSAPDHRNYRARVELLLVPVANVDGYEQQQRHAANGLDLNRDQSKLAVPETRLLKRAFSDFNPHVAVDFHEFRPFRRDFVHLGRFGVTSRNDIMFLYTGNLNVPDTVRGVIEQTFVHRAKERLAEADYSFANYSTSFDHKGDIHFNSGSYHARSSATSYALNNAISTLIEVRGVGIGKTSFLRRIDITANIALSYLQTTQTEADHLLVLFHEHGPQNTLAHVKMERTVEERPMTFIDMANFDELVLQVTVHDANQMRSKSTRPIPDFYAVPNETEYREKLDALGLRYQTNNELHQGSLEGYFVTSLEVEPYPYEGATIQQVEVELRPASSAQVQDYLWLSTHQQKRALLVELFEPETDNGWVHFGVVPAQLQDFLPIYRFTFSHEN